MRGVILGLTGLILIAVPAHGQEKSWSAKTELGANVFFGNHQVRCSPPPSRGLWSGAVSVWPAGPTSRMGRPAPRRVTTS